jgi:hypothetical protein
MTPDTERPSTDRPHLLPRFETGGPEYEFTPHQNEVVEDLGNSMRWASIPLMALSALCAVNLIMGIIWAVQTGHYRDWQTIGTLLFLLGTAILLFLFAMWTLRASAAFSLIPETRGKDMTLLMDALDSQRRMYKAFAVIVKLLVALAVIALILNLFGAFGEYRRAVIENPPVLKVGP